MLKKLICTANKAIYKYFIISTIVLFRGEWFWGFLHKFEKTQFFSEKELEEYQLSELNKLLKIAQTSNHYRDYSNNFHINKLCDLENLPILEKEQILYKTEDLKTQKKYFLRKQKYSSGSTGIPLRVYKNSNGMAREFAVCWRGYRWAGVDIGDRQARFMMFPTGLLGILTSKVIDYLLNRKRIRFDIINIKTWERVLNTLNKFKPSYLYGFPSALYEFTEYLKKNDLITNFKPKVIISTAEMLQDEYKFSMESYWSCRVINEYGCGEIGTIAHECECGNLHINDETVYVEVVNSLGEKVPDGVVGSLIITDLTNHYMPLIRYRVGDIGSIKKSDCSCGRSLTILNEIYGRDRDYFINKNGQKYYGAFFRSAIKELIKSNLRIEGYQFIQQDIEHIIVILVIDSDHYNAACDKIKNFFITQFDENVNIIFLSAEYIRREKSGKLKIIKSEII